MIKKFYRPLMLLLIILIIAFFLRVVGLDKNPPELFGDELDVGYQAYSLLKTGRDYKGHLLPVYLQSFSEWRAPFLMYVTVPFIAIFGLNEWGVRLPSAIFGSLAILLVYQLVYFLNRDKRLSLLTAFFLTISPWHIQYSRAAFEASLLLFLIISGILVFLYSKKMANKRLAMVAGILLALALYTYNTANIFVPLLMALLSLLYCLPIKMRRLTAITWITFLMVIIPLVVNVIWGHAADRFQSFSIFGNQEIIGKINQMRSYPNTSVLLETIFHNKPVEWLKRIIQNYATAFSPQFLFIHGDVTFRHSLHEIGEVFWFQLPLILTGLYLVIKNRHQKQSLFWLGWLLISPLPASLTIDGGYHATRLILMVIPLSVLSAYGGLAVIKIILYLKKKNILLLSVLITFIVLAPLAEFLHYQHYYWKHYPLDSWRWWHYGYKEAMRFLISSENQYDQIIIETTYEPALIRYIFWKKYDPRIIHKTDDQIKKKAFENLNGFCLDEKTCFVDFGGSLTKEHLKSDILYLVSQEKNVPGNWDWSQNPPDWIEVIKTVKNPWGEPIFYLVTAVGG